MSEEKKQSTKTCADLFIECLENEGVEVIFGLPGEENADFVMALSKSEKIKFVLVRHEQGAAFMADAYGRLTGKPAVCFGTLGPGATNLVTGVADANMDRAPLIVLTGQADTLRLHKESHQNMDVRGMFEPITKWGVTVLSPKTVPEIVRKAFKTARREKPGACHIELPENIAHMSADGLSPLPPAIKVRRAVPDDKSIDALFEKLASATRPVVLAGNGVLRDRATKQLELFCDATNIPVVQTFMAKGSVARSKPYACFTVGLASGDHNNILLSKSDLVICIGFDMVEYHPRLWNKKGNLAIAHIDYEPAEVDAHYIPCCEIVGDLAHSLWMINERLTANPRKFEDTYSEIRQKMLDDFAFHSKDSGEALIRPQRIIWGMRQVLGEEDILLSDVGAHKMWIARYWTTETPNTCLISNGFCSMGFSLPGAIGAKIAYPERRVLSVCGDGGFLMNVQEMETAKRIGVNIVVLVWCDGGYGLIAWKQDTQFGRHTELEFNNPNFDLLGKSFGWESFEIKTSDQVEEVLEKAFNVDGPALVYCNVDYRENPILTKRLGELQTQM